MTFPAYRFVGDSDLTTWVVGGSLGLLGLYLVTRKKYPRGFRRGFLSETFTKQYPFGKVSLSLSRLETMGSYASVTLSGHLRVTDHNVDLTKLAQLFHAFETEDLSSGSLSFFKLNQFENSHEAIEKLLEEIDEFFQGYV